MKIHSQSVIIRMPGMTQPRITPLLLQTQPWSGLAGEQIGATLLVAGLAAEHGNPGLGGTLLGEG